MIPGRRRLILFTRYPQPGQVKTRLIPALGAEGAAGVHRRLFLRTLRTAVALCQAHEVELEIRLDGGDAAALQHWIGERWCRSQIQGDLGERMANAFDQSFQEGSPETLLIGSDCPNLTSDLLANAFEKLSSSPAVVGPASDGGYYLIGLNRCVPEL